MRTHSLQFLPLLLAALALQTAPDRLTSTTYRLTDLGTLGTPGTYSFSAAYCINAAGQIGGISTASSIPPTSPAFLFQWQDDQPRHPRRCDRQGPRYQHYRPARGLLYAVQRPLSRLPLQQWKHD